MNKDDFIISEEEKEEIYLWLDTFNFSKPKQSIARDFCDGVLFAEIVKSKYPRMVELHNYIKSPVTKEKLANWETLNRKIFTKMGFNFLKKDIDDIIICKPNAVEKALKILKFKLELFKENKKKHVEKLLKTHDKDMLEKGYENKELGYEIEKPKNNKNTKTIKNKSIPKTEKNVKNDNNKNQIEKEVQEKNEFISDLIDTIDILELKIKNLEQLLNLKDEKINDLKLKLVKKN